MLNFYSKLTTAFAAFAIICSTSVSAQVNTCGTIYICDGTSDIGNAGWSADCADGSDELLAYCCYNASNYAAYGEDALGVAACDGYLSGINTCSTIYLCDGTSDIGNAGWSADCADGSDEVLEFCCNNADSFTAYGVDVLGMAACGFAPPADVEGCMDSSAENFNPDATIDDGSCISCSDVTVTFNMYDSNGDGWNDNGWNPIGGLEFQGVFYPFADGVELSVELCVLAGCYLDQIFYFDYWGSENSWDITIDGIVIASDDGSTYYNGLGGVYFSIYTDVNQPCVVFGCVNETACNYDDTATFNDGNCEYESCAGCMDSTACNYDDTATFDDGCDYSCIGCMDSTANNYDVDAYIECVDCCTYCELTEYVFSIGDSFGDGICCTYGDGYYTVTADGIVVASGADWIGDSDDGEFETTVFCAAAEACIVVSLLTDTYSGETDWVLSVDGLEVGVNPILSPNTLHVTGFGTCTSGCSDAGACNYAGPVDLDNGSCDFSCIGCMVQEAANFDPGATIAGDCIFCDTTPSNYEFLLTIDMYDSYGDGWNGAQYFITDDAGTVYSTGSLDTAFLGDGEGLDLDGNVTNVSEGTDFVCLLPGCYNFQVGPGSYPSEVSVVLSDDLESNYGSIPGDSNWPLDFFNTGQCDFTGCMSASAINYNPSASIDDGSCQEPPSNDQLANADAVACGGPVSGSLLYSTDDQGLIGEEFGNTPVGDSGVWYVFNAAADQQIIASTCNTPTNADDGSTDYSVDTKLHVYSMGLDGSLVGVAAVDDGCDELGGLSLVAFNVTTGSDYYILVSGSNTDGNDFVLSVDCVDCGDAPINDNCDGAVAQVTGQTFTGSTCCANPDDVDLWYVDVYYPGAAAYGVWFTFNSSNYNTFYFDITNVSNQSLEWMMFENSTCETIDDFVACGGITAGESCTGSVEEFLAQLEPNSDYYFLVFNMDPTACGEFEFTTTGVILGCTDAQATNFDPEALQDDGTCDFEGVVPANDTCEGAVALECNTVTTGSTGGATTTGSPLGVLGCEQVPGAGVWYSFVGDGQVHDISTCGSAINSKINIYSADVACGVFECIATASSSEGNCSGNDDDDDVSINLVSDVGVLYYLLVGSQGTDGAFDLTFDCAVAVDGCTNSAACNYAEAANADDGTCDFWSCVCDTETGVPFQFIMNDSWGDGWNGNTYSILDSSGEVVANGDIETAQYITSPGLSGYDFICLEPGCYNVTVDGGLWQTEISWSIVDQDGDELSFGGSPGIVSVSLGGVCGCIDSTACNYNPLATSDDGTCEFDSCAGCMDSTACNYDDTATLDDGTFCCYSNCLSMTMFDQYSDGWSGGYYTLSLADGTVIMENVTLESGSASQTDTYCLADGCYTLEVVGGTYANEMSWSLSGAVGGVIFGVAYETVTFSLGSSEGCVYGCDISCACNYDASVNISVVEDCVFSGCSGCTYPDSPEYSEAALTDDGSCTFLIANPCPEDLNGDGSVTTGDLLQFLGAFGTIC
jgi:hypothetical protein